MTEQRILITGASGLVGTALRSVLPGSACPSSAACDLRNAEATFNLFRWLKPTHVFHLAATVGGIGANMKNMGAFYENNIRINTNVLSAAREMRVTKLISLLSTCVYPDECDLPLTETDIHAGPPHASNYGYAYAKRMLDVQSRAFRQQFGCNFITAIPNNIFGMNDNFDLEDSHVIPAIIRKVFEAKKEKKDKVVFWGTGRPLREFTYAPDIATVLLFLMDAYNSSEPINIGNIGEHSIGEVVDKVCKIFNYKDEVVWDVNKPDGQFRKPSSNAKLRSLGYDKGCYTDFDAALKETCLWFKKNYPKVRGVESD